MNFLPMMAQLVRLNASVKTMVAPLARYAGTLNQLFRLTELGAGRLGGRFKRLNLALEVFKLLSKKVFDYVSHNALTTIRNVGSRFSGFVKRLGIQLNELAASFSFTALFKSTASHLDQTLTRLHALKAAADRAGESVTVLQRFSYAAEATGVATDVAVAALESIAMATEEAAQCVGEGAAIFNLLGISAVDSQGRIKGVEQIFAELMNTMEELSEQQQIDMLGRLGIDKSMVAMLNLSTCELEQLTQEAEAFGLVSEKNAQAAQQYTKSMAVLRGILQAVGTVLAVQLEPVITDLVRRFKEFYLANKDAITKGVAATVRWLKIAVDVMLKFARGLDIMISSTIGWENALMLLTGALLAIKAIGILSNPLGLIIAGIMLISWLVADFFDFINGKESALSVLWAPLVTGLRLVITVFKWFLGALWDGLCEKFNRIKNLVTLGIKIFSTVLQLAIAVFKWFLGVLWDGLCEKFNRIKNLVTSWITIVTTVIDTICTLFKALWSLSTGFITSLSEGWNGWLNRIEAIAEQVKSIFSTVWDGILTQFDALMATVKANVGWAMEKAGWLADKIGSFMMGNGALGLGVRVFKSITQASDSVGAAQESATHRAIGTASLMEREGSATYHAYNQDIKIEVNTADSEETAYFIVRKLNAEQQRLSARNYSTVLVT